MTSGRATRSPELTQNEISVEHRGGLAIVAAGFLLSLFAQAAHATTFIDASFDMDEDGFIYRDDAFRGSQQPAYASGVRIPAGGFAGGALQVSLGGVDAAGIDLMSGGWERIFTLAGPEALELTLRCRLTQRSEYESDELSQVMVSFEGRLIGMGRADFVAEVKGDGNGGIDRTTGWRLFRAGLGIFPAGSHSLIIGGFNNHKSDTNVVDQNLG